LDPLASNGMNLAIGQGISAARAAAATIKGDSRPRCDYQARATTVFKAYLEQRATYYGHAT
jgi:hypothetical protein